MRKSRPRWFYFSEAHVEISSTVQSPHKLARKSQINKDAPNTHTSQQPRCSIQICARGRTSIKLIKACVNLTKASTPSKSALLRQLTIQSALKHVPVNRGSFGYFGGGTVGCHIFKLGQRTRPALSYMAFIKSKLKPRHVPTSTAVNKAASE